MICCEKCGKEDCYLITVDMTEELKYKKTYYVGQTIPKEEYHLCEECAKPILDILDGII